MEKQIPSHVSPSREDYIPMWQSGKQSKISYREILGLMSILKGKLIKT